MPTEIDTIFFCSKCGLNSKANVYTIYDGDLLCQHCYRNMKEAEKKVFMLETGRLNLSP